MSDDRQIISEIDLSVIIPAFNEEAAIGGVVDELRRSLNSHAGEWEIIVVDDASTDRTAEVALELGARVVRHDRRRGSGAARKSGIRAARGAIIAMLDGDGSYPADELPSLLSFIEAFDQVNGARRCEAGTHKWLRSPVKWGIRKFAEVASGHRIPDLNTGMKVFKREAMLPYLDVVSDGFSCVTSMTLVMLCDGHRVKYVPISYRPRIGMSKFRPIRDTTRYVWTVLRIVWLCRPLRLSLVVGLGLLCLAIVSAGVERWLFGLVPPPVANGLAVTAAAVVLFGFAGWRRARRRRRLASPPTDVPTMVKVGEAFPVSVR